MSILFYPFHSLPLKLSNKGIDFPFPPLKLPNKGRKKYSKIILFIPFHSIPSSQTRAKGCTNSTTRKKRRKERSKKKNNKANATLFFGEKLSLSFKYIDHYI